MKHGHTRGHHGTKRCSREYSSWVGARARCNNPNRTSYKTHGGRGIKVCERWLGEHGFENFLADMGARPEGKTLDRYPNNDGNYEPLNCRWATVEEQLANRRKHAMLCNYTAEELLAEIERRK